ncbi:MAG: hypothetical protein ACXADH_01160 [Candidatus Kariarchaeaceae archaeon]|jgi:hypothetical protein
MSIKNLFDKRRNELPQTTNQEMLENVESTQNLLEKSELKTTFVPQIDYSEPENFTKFGSARLYYKSAIERIYDYYPYDGSDAEINSFTNRSLPHERYIFDNLYPRTNGYANFNGSSYISLKGGPHATSYDTLGNLFRDAGSTKRTQANIYETNIYQADNKPSDYASGTRESNLKSNFQTGVTVEFWLKAPSPSANTKQTIFHLTNSSGGDALTISLSGTTGSPFHVSLDNSGSPVFTNQQIGSSPTTSSIEDWKHYAVSFKSASSGITTKLYVNGKLDSTNNLGSSGVDTLTQKGTIAYIASGSSGYLSGSIDEFRFWKAERNGFEIGTNYFSQVRGGANSDTSNASLGVYYKFNEGTTGDSSIDKVVLDYAGRITNGTWNGTVSRTLESAIVEAGAAATEYKDPIIYENHPSVSSLKSDLESKGAFYDSNNTTKFVNYLPSWVIEQSENEEKSQLEMVSHIIGSYFDKIYLQIQAVSDFKQPLYTSSSYKPLPFARHLPQSLGLYTPEIFVDSDIINTIANKTENFNFETDLEDTKNLIYLNLYNNLASIFKSKGTEKSIKSILRCFYVDDQIIKLNTYSNKARYELRNNLEQTTKLNKYVNFNNSSNVDAVIYQKQDPSDTTNTIGYLSGSESEGYEFAYGATVEADITFPYFNTTVDVIDRRFNEVSLFGVVSASVDSPDDTTFLATDNTNFQVFAVRETEKSKNAYFKLTSSISPNPFPQITSSVFFGVYNNQDWNFSVSIIPNKSDSLKFVTGSDDYAYTLRFEGNNTLLGDVRDSFSIDKTLTKTQGENFLKSAKRVYAGAYRDNLTGSLVNKSDVLVSGVRYWLKSIDQNSKKQHALDFDNVGRTDSYQNISSLDSNTKDLDILNKDTLALSWEFSNLSSSDSGGNFYITDFSSGSALVRDNFGWVGSISGYQHSAYGFGFAASSSDIIDEQRINVFKFVDPERTISSDMVTLVDDSQELYGIPKDVVGYHHTLEKSMYSAVSDEMLKFFAGAADFNNLIGEPVNRYRMDYKALEKLRQAFFLRVENVKEVERYIEYYKWFDDSLGDIIKQLVPASAVISDNVFDVIESHVLERNKYQSKFPTIEFKPADPESPALGIREKTYDWERGHHPVSNSQRENSEYWQKRAKREDSDVISSGVDAIDEQRDGILETADKYNTQAAPTISDKNRNTYSGQTYALRKLSRPYKLNIDRRTNPPRIIKGGTNFEVNKNFGYHRVALHPAGPINNTDGVFVPKNVLLGFTEDLVELENTTDLPKNPNVLIKRNIKIQSGRDWEDGVGYKNMKSDIVFPFNIVSSSVTTGYNKQVVDRVTASVEIVNLHNDVYGDDMERPMQGPFTDYAVGGLQNRHIKLNDGNDNYLNRPEAWKIALGLCEGVTGAIGMIGADYPYPEANAVGANPYPMTGAQKAYLYRDMVAKRPVNIRNIRHTTGSTILGNYNHNYDVVQAGDAFSNPRQFVDKQPDLPATAFNNRTRYATSIRTLLDINRNNGGHNDFNEDYSVEYLHSSSGDSVIISRFSAPGGVEVMTKGYQDFRSSTYSVYNALNARNQTVRRSFQGVSSSIVSETSGMRNFDHTGRDFGLTNLSARHSARFFRDSTLETNPGTSYNESPSFHRVHRNNKVIGIFDSENVRQNNDNLNIQHQIPRSDRQYRWISASIVHQNSEDPRYAGFMKTGINKPPIDAPYYVITGTYVPFFDYVSASDPGSAIYQNTTRLNLLVTDETGSEQNVLGVEELQRTSLTTLPEHRRLNALLIRRGDLYGWNWSGTRQQNHPILRIEKQENKLTAFTNGQLISYDMKPVNMSGRPVYLSVYKTTQTQPNGATMNASASIEFKASYNNYKQGFADADLQNISGLNTKNRKTNLEDFMMMINRDPQYVLNWVVYSENIFPSQRNAFDTDRTFRNEYDNQYWRYLQDDREVLGNTLSNSFGVAVSQSSWILDAVPDFNNRVAPPGTADLKVKGGGELQNTYFHYFDDVPPAPSDGVIREALTPSALYARKHLMPTYKSVVTPSGIRIPQTGSSHTSLVSHPINVFGGEARWEAGAKAGVVDYSGDTPLFVNKSSEPWFNNYSDYKAELSKISKDYSIVPEFRISEKVSTYLKAGTNGVGAADTFEIVGTPHNSDDDNFYKDYSNSEFLKEFANISEITDTTPKEIRLVCKAVTRFNPYKGFYPAQRTIDMVEQFAESYENSFAVSGLGVQGATGRDAIENNGSLMRPLLQPLFAPGILYNTIKSGIGVDFPVITTPKKRVVQGTAGGTQRSIFALAGEYDVPGQPGTDPELFNTTGQYWNKRLPFETILDPDRHLANIQLFDMEPHPSASLNATASFFGQSTDQSFKKMSNNFFAEVADFFLKDSEYTTLKSGIVEGALNFESGSFYGARLKIKRSTKGDRTYDFDYDKMGNQGSLLTSGFAENGLRVSSSFGFGTSSIQLPQDPKDNPRFKETFTMYSRPSAFGPAVWGRGEEGGQTATITENSGALDSLVGYNWSFTPPYYHGESWADLIFYPDHTKSYTLEQILSEIEVRYWRVDKGYTQRKLMPEENGVIYSADSINANAMQLDAVLNLFGIENIQFEETNQATLASTTRNTTVAQRWVIQPKAETPMMNFNDEGVNEITTGRGYSLSPTYASESVPRGMWHQFGNMPEDPSKGIFLEIGDIPTNWLQFHPSVTATDSIYNNQDATNNSGSVYQNMKSLTDLLGFENSSTRLGELKESQTIREAIVAIPYITIGGGNCNDINSQAADAEKKQFFSIPRERIDAAMNVGSLRGDSDTAAGDSIRDLIANVKQYVLPPEFDFVADPKKLPLVMYFFEFEYKLDKDDLSYIWQNLAPRNYKQMKQVVQKSAHKLAENELLQPEDILENNNLRWMVFKVKQRGMAKYENKIYRQAGAKGEATQASGYEVNYNWPYDYVSFVEMINMDVEVLMDDEVAKTATKAKITTVKVPQFVDNAKITDGLEQVVVQKALSMIDDTGNR